ncbi:pentatricopeptide repeat-containing protein MRL1, chloroplastic [Andrographis paniculata]|uniref:pentatricopeptide repeat-containing protein MRL1, chloroplastic n=1 Tax=Andrographis paniculata TaxID=175694 RepID=UPI0021E8A6E0|nr:pentatricopeptide repeat-containing protein MRL1, chloroplastic [Andrographis paniculata]
MESSFSLRPRAISSLAHVPACSALYARPGGLLRSEFLGCGHSLRLPRKRWKKPWQKSRSHCFKFLFRASLDSQQILFVTAAVSAATVVYFTYSRKYLNAIQMSGSISFALSEQIRSMMSWILSDQHYMDLRNNDSIGRREDSLEDTKEDTQVNKDIFGESKIRSDKVSSETLTEEISQFQSRIFASSATYSSTSRSSDVSEADLDAASAVNHIHGDPDKFSRLELLEEADINYSNLIFADSTCKELYTINEASMENLDNLDALSSFTILQNNNGYSPFIKDSLMERSNHAPCNVILPLEKIFLEKFEEGRPFGYSSQSFLCQQKESINRKELRKKGKNLSASSNPKGERKNDKHDPLWQLRVYNQLLREGRLNDCIQLLEDLEENGLLDMDKVYHVRFFEVCKRQRAVKEAFRFTRFIHNPTLSTFNMLMSVCASSQDLEGAFQVLQLVREAGLIADCKLYTTLVSTCAKSGKVDTMFKVFHEMVNAGIEPNVHTYGALIDGCARAGQVAKAFGAYGILRSKNVEPDRVVFNALITACGQSGAVDRAFDVLAEMRAETKPIDPDHVTIGALMKACAKAGQVDRAKEVYSMIHEYDIRGNAELYTIAVNSCSQQGDWEFACCVYNDMLLKETAPDEMFISALIDVAGHAGKVEAAFEILQEARARGMHVGIISYSSLMGACSNAGDWQKALELYGNVKGLNLKPTVSLMNALITALCNADKLQKATDMLFEMRDIGLCPNTITYSILLAASEKNDDLEAGLKLVSLAKKDGVTPNLVMCRCLVAMCLRRFQMACMVGEPVLSFSLGRAQLNSKWTSLALMVYRETIIAGVQPTMDELSQVLGCLKLPHDLSVRDRLIENLGLNANKSKGANLYSLIEGFGEYDPRAFSLVEEASSLGILPLVSWKESPIVVDIRKFSVHTAEVYLLTVLKGLKHRLAAGARVPNVAILLPVENMRIQTSAGDKTIHIASRISQAIAALLRRLGLSYLGNESYGKIRINGVIIRKWFQPKFSSRFNVKRIDHSSSMRYLGSGISHQQRKIRTGYLSLE